MNRWIPNVALVVTILGLFSCSQALAGLSIGGRAGFSGYSEAETSESAPVFGAYVKYTLPVLGFGIRGEVDYWSKTYGEEPAEFKWSDISISATGLYPFSLPGSPVVPYVGAGVGLHMYKTELDFGIPGVEPLDGSDTYFGVHGVGGAELMVNPMLSVFAEGKYGVIFSEGESTGVWAVIGGVGYHLGM
jgi:hypothetical protein